MFVRDEKAILIAFSLYQKTGVEEKRCGDMFFYPR